MSSTDPKNSIFTIIIAKSIISSAYYVINIVTTMCIHSTNTSVHYYYRYSHAGDAMFCIYCIWEKYSTRGYVSIELDLLDSTQSIKYFWTDEHKKRIDSADLNFPIFVNEYYEIIDGRHRIIKSRNLGMETINAIILTDDDLMQCKYK